ncbi:venom acid phosphatase Acph-1-like [Copidosoma floridanum]|uniref:venom acid phosphatase Acph-1-like n=1 Tax=Copidosoma floridanum TaxID=29053 RepID=UPI0006C989F9|nr:venom acid phosphatase Acph-1-like [Copidosoma floridanum]
MLKILLLCCTCYIQISSATDESAGEKSNLELDLVQVIFRHGVRTPLEQEAKFINITDPSIYGYDFGQLTKEGMKQEYVLGKLLREHYNEHLGTYDKRDVVAVSTPSHRTRMSLELVLAGLFPPTRTEQLFPELTWRPIRYEITNSTADSILAPHQSSRFIKLYKRTMEHSKEYKTSLSNHTEFIKHLENWTGHSYFDDVLYSCGWTAMLLEIHRLLNITLPNWCTEEVHQTIAVLRELLYGTLSLTGELRKVNGGPLIRKVIENVETNAHDRKKIYLYSTHDLTLASFTRAQCIINAFKVPPFGSAYIVESYKDTMDKRFIRMLSWDGASDHFVELEIDNCGKYCPVDEYKIQVQDVVPTEEELKFFSAYTSGFSKTLPKIQSVITTALISYSLSTF